MGEKTATTFLDRIRKEKLAAVEARKQLRPEFVLETDSQKLPPTRDFAAALRRPAPNRLAVIAEVKVKAPGRQNINCLDLEAVVQSYEQGGANAISVLTDETYFGGSLENLNRTRQLSHLPLLHKEFILTRYQLLEGRLNGADAALLLVYYFTESELQQMTTTAQKLGLEPVVECSLPNEVAKAVQLNPRVILINNRPIASIPANSTETYKLGTIQNARQFWENHSELRDWKAQPDRLLISASCIDSPKDVHYISQLPYDAVLVGNAVSQAVDPAAFIRGLQLA